MSFKRSICITLYFQIIQKTYFKGSIFCRMDVVVHRHEDDSIFEFFRSDPVPCHLPFVSWSSSNIFVSGENIPLELDWLSVDSVQFTIFRSIYKPFNFSIPVLYRLRMFMNFAKTKNRIRIRTHTFDFDSLSFSHVEKSF